MATAAESGAPARYGDARRGFISRLLTTFAEGIKWLLLSLLFSIVIEWLGMALWWPEQGLLHSRTLLETEIGYLAVDFDRSVVSADPAGFTKRVADNTHYALFEVTRVIDLMMWLSEPSEADATRVRPRLQRWFTPIADYVLVAMQVTQVFAVRLAILALATPVFALFSLVALVDGLVRRDLRRWGGGRESSFVYHWAKRSALPLLVLTWVIYLALPFSLHPSFVVLPFAAVFAFTVTVSASTFKKYL